jgi:hypothetical protein
MNLTKNKLVFMIVTFVLTLVVSLPMDGSQAVSPTAELETMIRCYEKGPVLSGALNVELDAFEKNLKAFKKKGGRLWGSEKWMRTKDYYKGLTTVQLARECFSRGIFASEMMAFAPNSEFAFARLEIMHKGFTELFDRKDLSNGILAVYEYLAAKIVPRNSLEEVVQASLEIAALAEFYSHFTPFREQVKGREKAFLDANIMVLRKFTYYIDNFDPEKVGTIIPFYRSPSVVANVALMLKKQVEPVAYARIITEISEVRFSRQQGIDEVGAYLDMLLKVL